jgi:RimJ/RimL family protein N-acetyltransferase
MDNLASIALAHKLGYKNEKEYRLLAWCKNQPSQ